MAESGIFRRTLITSTTRLSDDKKVGVYQLLCNNVDTDHLSLQVSDQASLAQKTDPKEAAAKKAAEDATKKALEKKRIEDAAAKKEEEAALAAKKKKEEEAKAKVYN